MKKSLVAAITLVVIPGILRAQKSISSPKSFSAKTTNTATVAPVPISDMDQRTIYHWDNGQRSTATGRQAGDPFAQYAMVMGDSAIVVYGWTGKMKSLKNPTAKH